MFFGANLSVFYSIQDFENGRIHNICWSPDGQILTVGTSNGNVYNFLAKMSVLSAKYKTNVAFLSSLREVSIVDAARSRGTNRSIDVTLKLEPSFIALGPRHIAAGKMDFNIS
jgi:WD repeat-containing protein 19